jgi:hypothetical protein
VSIDRPGASESHSGAPPRGGSVERRRALRIELPFPAAVRGVDRAGERFRQEAVLDNLSASGLYLWLARPVEPGTTLFVVVRLATAPDQPLAAPGVAARGVALRVEPQPGGRWGIAMAFRRPRFLYAVTT